MRSRSSSLILVGSTGRPPQQWARIAGWLCLLLPLPSVAWRLLMLAGVDVGFHEAALFRGGTGPALYVVALDVVEIAVGLACLGLIMPWGERVPRAVPGIGGRAIPRIVPAVICGLGLLAMYVIWVSMAAQFIPSWLGITEGWVPDRGMSGGERAFLLACYIPFALWPLAITAALIGYWRRRRP